MTKGQRHKGSRGQGAGGRDGVLLFAFLCAVLLFPPGVFARILKKPDAALKLIFPGAEIKVKNVVLKPEQAASAEKLFGGKLNSKLVSFYIAYSDSIPVGYAFADSHIVRTKMQTVLYVLTPKGEVDRIEILSFYEPMEYLADEKWLKTFHGKKLGEDILRLKRDVINISGATFTSRAITDNARKVLALWTVVFGEVK